MASKAKRKKKSAASGAEPVTRLCSINSNGLVFIASSRMEVSSEVTLSVQTNAPGVSLEWEVHGWVVDCRISRGADGLHYRVTLLFDDLPSGLLGVLEEERAAARHGFPALRHEPMFGLN